MSVSGILLYWRHILCAYTRLEMRQSVRSIQILTVPPRMPLCRLILLTKTLSRHLALLVCFSGGSVGRRHRWRQYKGR